MGLQLRVCLLQQKSDNIKKSCTRKENGNEKQESKRSKVLVQSRDQVEKTSLHSRIKIVNLVWLSKQTLTVVAALAHLLQPHCLTPVVGEATGSTRKIGRLLAWMNAGDDAHVASVVDFSLAIVDEALENACCSVTVDLLLFELSQSVRELFDLLSLLLDLLFLGSLFKSRLFNLCLCSSSLGTSFEEIGSSSFCFYKAKATVRKKRSQLTGDVRRSSEYCSNLRVKFNAVFYSELGVSFLFLLINPILEIITAFREENIDDVLQ